MFTVPDQTGRRIIVTGSNSGTGKEAAAALAAAGAQIIMGVRSIERGEAARQEILARTPEAQIEVRRLDLADLDVVREFAAGILADPAPLHMLVNNAGVMTPPDRELTAQGHELQWGSNFLGPFALTNLLLPKLLQTPGARVVTMSSGVAAMGSIRFADLDWAKGYKSFPAYAQSKLGNLLMGLRLAEVAEERGWDLSSTIAHPGYARTNLQSAGANLGSAKPTAFSRLLKMDLGIPSQDAAGGAQPLLMAAVAEDANGRFFGPSGKMGMVGAPAEMKPYRTATAGPDLATSLWAVAEAQTGTKLPE